jgi:hypothetical protein
MSLDEEHAPKLFMITSDDEIKRDSQTTAVSQPQKPIPLDPIDPRSAVRALRSVRRGRTNHHVANGR